MRIDVRERHLMFNVAVTGLYCHSALALTFTSNEVFLYHNATSSKLTN
jgi:hypothetical protein